MTPPDWVVDAWDAFLTRPHVAGLVWTAALMAVGGYLAWRWVRRYDGA